jgi:ATP-dependent Clp protease ATP-binding subunit ClpC
VFERFTDGSRRAVVLAQESAVELHHRTITVEHLLLGVARVEQGTAAVALADQGATPDRLRRAVREIVPAGASAPTEHLPFTAAAKQSMEFSLREAMQRGANAIDSGHLLLALLRQGGDELPAVLSAAGVDGVELGSVVERRLAEAARNTPDPPSANRGQLDRVETLLMDVQARLARIEARLNRPGPS